MFISNYASSIRIDSLGWALKIPWNLALGILTESIWPNHSVECANALI